MATTYVRNDQGEFELVGPGGATTDTTLSQSGKPADASAVGVALANKVTKEYVDTSIASFSNPNLLINGDFQIWQRGESFSNIENQYTADRWLIKNAKAKTSLVEMSTDVPSSDFMRYSIHMTETSEENSYLRYMFEYGLKGTYTLSFWYKTSAAFNSYIYDNGALVYLGKQTTLNTWTKAIYTFTVTSMTFLSIIHAMSIGDTYITGVKLECGSTATPFAPRLYAEELALCQRYYIKTNGIRLPIIHGTSSLFMTIPLTTTMRVIPTIIFSKTNIVIVRDNMSTSLNCTIGANRVNMTSTHLILTIDSNYGSDVFQTGCVAEDFPIAFDAEIY